MRWRFIQFITVLWLSVESVSGLKCHGVKRAKPQMPGLRQHCAIVIRTGVNVCEAQQESHFISENRDGGTSKCRALSEWEDACFCNSRLCNHDLSAMKDKFDRYFAGSGGNASAQRDCYKSLISKGSGLSHSTEGTSSTAPTTTSMSTSASTMSPSMSSKAGISTTTPETDTATTRNRGTVSGKSPKVKTTPRTSSRATSPRRSRTTTSSTPAGTVPSVFATSPAPYHENTGLTEQTSTPSVAAPPDDNENADSTTGQAPNPGTTGASLQPAESTSSSFTAWHIGYIAVLALLVTTIVVLAVLLVKKWGTPKKNNAKKSPKVDPPTEVKVDKAGGLRDSSMFPPAPNNLPVAEPGLVPSTATTVLGCTDVPGDATLSTGCETTGADATIEMSTISDTTGSEGASQGL